MTQESSEEMNSKLPTAIALYVASVVLANYVTAHHGLVSVGFGLMVTAGTYFAGFALLARDFINRYGNRYYALAAIAVAGVVSWFMSTPDLAVASTTAFVVAELVDLVVFERISSKAGFVAGAVASNAISAPLDTYVFLSLAGFPLTTEIFAGQIVGKFLWATLVPLVVYVVARFLVNRRQAVTA